MLLLFIIENSIFNSKITWFLQLEKYKQMGSLESICMHIDTWLWIITLKVVLYNLIGDTGWCSKLQYYSVA